MELAVEHMKYKLWKAEHYTMRQLNTFDNKRVAFLYDLLIAGDK